MADGPDWRAQPFGGSSAPSTGADFLSSFGGEPSSQALVPAGPPWGWAVSSLILGTAGLAISAALGGAIALASFGWLLGGPAAITLAAIYLRRDTVRRAQSLRVDYAWARPLYVSAIVVAFAAVIVASLRLAFWFGRHAPWG